MMLKTLSSLALLMALVTASTSAQDFYDDSTLREVRLNFHDANWWNQLNANWPGGPNILADMTVDAVVYPSVGVRIKGNSSYFFLPPGSKKVSLNVEVDFTDPDLRLYGMKTLNLNNGIEDPTFCREATYQNIIHEYTPNGRGSHVKLWLNDESWGVYVNIQQYNKDLLEEFYRDENGARFKCPNNPNGPGLRYMGANKGSYTNDYELRDDGGHPTPWQLLIDTCDTVTNEPITNYAKIDGQLSIDQAMWTLAVENLFMDEDSYISKGADFNLYWDPWEKRAHLHQHDGNEVFGVSFFGWPGGTLWELQPLYGQDNVNHPVQQRLWDIPEVQQRYLAHLRTMLDETFRWDVMGPRILGYKAMIEAEVLADDKKIYTDQDFLDNFDQNVVIPDGNGGTMIAPGLQLFVDGRRTFLLNHPAVRRKAPIINAVWHSPAHPEPSDTVRVMARVSPSEKPVGVVKLWYQNKPGRYRQVAMADDGMSGDGGAGDGLYAVDLPANGTPGQRMAYYVSAATDTKFAPLIFMPRKTEFDPLIIPFTFGDSELKITEYMYSGTDGEFFELTNLSANPIDLTGWSMDDQTGEPGAFDLSAAGIVAPGQSIVVTDMDPVAFAGAWGLGGTTVLGPNLLSNLGRNDQINLYDAGGVLVDQLTYGDQAFPDSPRAKEASAQACLEALGADDPYQWNLAVDGDVFGAITSAGGDVGSPGLHVLVDCPGVGSPYCDANANSTGVPAVLAAEGSPLVSDNNLTLLGSSLPAGKFGYSLMSLTQDFKPLIGGSQGNLCLGGSIVRFAKDAFLIAPDGTASFSPDLTQLPGGVQIQPGERWNFQFWFRDNNPGATSNFTNGVELMFL